jgi:hypothetical protein
MISIDHPRKRSRGKLHEGQGELSVFRHRSDGSWNSYAARLDWVSSGQRHSKLS